MRRASVRRGHARAAAAPDSGLKLGIVVLESVHVPLIPPPCDRDCNAARPIDFMTWDPRQRSGTGRFVEEIVELQVHARTRHAHTHTPRAHAHGTLSSCRCTRHMRTQWHLL